MPSKAFRIEPRDRKKLEEMNGGYYRSDIYIRFDTGITSSLTW